MIKAIHRLVPYIVALSEFSHIFCCGLPVLFSVLGLLSGLGMVAAMPHGITVLHDTLHHYELPMIIVSSAILALGWVLEWYSHKNDCEDHHCHCDEACKPKKDWNKIILKAATVLLFINLVVYFGMHRTTYIQEHILGIHVEQTHDHDHHEHEEDHDHNHEDH